MDIAAKIEAIAKVSELSVTYRHGGSRPIHALDRATLAIAAGQRVGILGESGSGKSTLAAAVLRLFSVDTACSGSIRFRNRELLALREREMGQIRGAEIALIPQDPAQALNPVMCVGEQIAEVLRAHARMTRRDRRTRVDELLAEVGFDPSQEIYGAYPHELSGGQRQRVVIAQAVACRPSLVIADEPTSKLDASLREEILFLMRDISQRHRMALVVISHDPTVLAGIADCIAVMYAGRVVEEGSTQDVFRRPLHPYTQALVRLSARHLLTMSRPTRLPLIAGESPDRTSLEKGCRFAARCPERRQACTESDPQETTPLPSHRVTCFKYDE